MKNLSLLCLICFLVSCSGTKKIVDTAEIPKTKSKDTVKTGTTEIIKLTDSLYVPEDKNDIQIVDKPLIVLINKTNEKTKSFSHETFHQLLQKYVTESGNVDYKGIKTNYSKLQHYIVELGKNLPKNTASRETKLAYWINAYNALTIDLILRNYPIKSIKDIKDPWQQRHWILGNKWYNLDEIEHQILRNMSEPRIHFAIVCASYSCPKLQNEAFVASNLEQQLTKVTKEFLNDPERNSISKDNLELSKIFKWFSKDFKRDGSLIDFLNQYTDVKISTKARINYKDYNWDLNE